MVSFFITQPKRAGEDPTNSNIAVIGREVRFARRARGREVRPRSGELLVSGVIRITRIDVRHRQDVRSRGNPYAYYGRAFSDRNRREHYVWGRTHDETVILIEEWAKRRKGVLFVNGAVQTLASVRRTPVSD